MRHGYFLPKNKALISFTTDVEIRMHKIVSALRYGEKITIEVNGDYREYVYAVKKSAYYNCMDDLSVSRTKDKKSIIVKVDI